MAAYYLDMLPMNYEQPAEVGTQPDWFLSALFFQAAGMVLVLTLIILCYALEAAEKEEELKRVVERLDALEQQEIAPVLEITHETPAAGARGRAGRTISHLRIHRNPYARAD